MKSTGKVWLVGAAPGDPELLTLKAVGAIANADVLPGDDLVNPAVLAHASGVPLTHRDWSSGAIFVTGHERQDEHGEARTPDWASLAQSGSTLVIYMGVARCRQIQAALLAGGKAGSTPVAVIQSATGRGQAHLLTTLADLADDLAMSGLGSPSIIVVGDVVRCADVVARPRLRLGSSRA